MTDHGKAQWVRLADVFAIGPLMSYAGWLLRQQRPVVGWTMFVLGITTVLYNGRNYLRLREAV